MARAVSEELYYGPHYVTTEYTQPAAPMATTTTVHVTSSPGGTRPHQPVAPPPYKPAATPRGYTAPSTKAVVSDHVML